MGHAITRALCAAIVLAAFGLSASSPARAGVYKPFVECERLFKTPQNNNFDWKYCLGVLLWTAVGEAPKSDTPPPPPAPAKPRSATYIVSNIGASLTKGQPTFGGRMKNPIWGHMDPNRDSRVVVHTFGSDVDTVLAVYGAEVKKNGKIKYELLRGNDDTPVPGLGRGWSLVTVDLKKKRSYHVQIGGQDGAETSRIALTATAFGPKGGISAFLLSTSIAATMQNRDLVCSRRPCADATFIVHNSGKSRAAVTPSTTLTRFYQNPQPISLGAGEIAVVTFAGRDFVNTNGVAETGLFSFNAVAGGETLESVTKNAAVFLSDPAGSSDDLAASAPKRLRVGFVNEALSFTVRLRHTGADAARGCGFYSWQSDFRNILTRFRTIDAGGEPTGDWGEFADIPAGQQQDFEVSVASIAPRQGDPEFGLADEMVASCLNRRQPAADLLNTLEVNADGAGVYTVIDAKIVGGGALAAPARGQASFDVVAKNRLRTAELVARPVYVRPFDQSDPDKQYALSVCRLGKRDKCDGAKSFDAPWAAKKGDEARFRVFVKAPKKKPPSGAASFRIYLKFVGDEDEWPNLFGAESVAVRVK